VPIIPMILVNGTKGIGTGFSTEILCYNPRDIIVYLKNLLQDKSAENSAIQFMPYYEGFTGTISKTDDHHYLFKGKYEVLGADMIRVMELPVGFWTEDFKELLEDLLNDKDKDGQKINPPIKHYDDNSKDTNIDFVITFVKGKLADLESTTDANGNNGVDKLFKLCKSASTTNMNLFDYDDKLKKYHSIPEIIDDFFGKRLEHYNDRKQFLINAIEKELVVLSNKARYIQEVLDGTVDLRKKKKDEIIALLAGKGYDLIEDDTEFRYLTRMPMDSVSEENVEKIKKDCKNKMDELARVKETTIQQMWLSELAVLEDEYQVYIQERTMKQIGEIVVKKKSSVVKKVAVAGAVKKTVKKASIVNLEVIDEN